MPIKFSNNQLIFLKFLITLSMSEDEKRIIWIAALKNAVEFNGKANPKAIMGKLMGQRPDLRSQSKKYFPLINEICNEVNDLNAQILVKISSIPAE